MWVCDLPPRVFWEPGPIWCILWKSVWPKGTALNMLTMLAVWSLTFLHLSSWWKKEEQCNGTTTDFYTVNVCFFQLMLKKKQLLFNYWPLNVLYLYRSYELCGDICAFLCIRLLLFQCKKKQIWTECKQKKEKRKNQWSCYKHQHVITFVISIDYESYKWPIYI